MDKVVIMKTISEHIRDAFQGWCNDWLLKPYEQGGFGFDKLSVNPSKFVDRNGISTFLGPEADVQMHFGFYLFNHLAAISGKDKPLQWAVHAEEKVFEQGRASADLIVTKVDRPTMRSAQDIWDNAVALIEIKGQAFHHPYSSAAFLSMVSKDFSKLTKLRPELATKAIAKFVLVYHENFADNEKFEKDFPKNELFDGIELLIPKKDEKII